MKQDEGARTDPLDPFAGAGRQPDDEQCTYRQADRNRRRRHG
jgi:hypothetical protein